MALFTAFGKALTRRAAIDDLGLTLTVARYTLRLLRIAARDATEKHFAESLESLLEDAGEILRRLN